MTQLCADCQTANHDNAKFCRGCGRRLAIAEATQAPQPHRRPEDWPATQRLPLEEEDELLQPARSASRPRPAKAAAVDRKSVV